jgi:hypothetical protein
VRRYLIVVASVVAGAGAGLLGGMGFFAWVDPHPNAATQAGMGEALLILFWIVPACAIAAGVIAVKVTQRRGLSFEISARARKGLTLVLAMGIVMLVTYSVVTFSRTHRWGVNYRFDMVNKTGHPINGLAVSVAGNVVASADRLGDGGSHTEFSPPAAVPVEVEVRWFDGATQTGVAHSSTVRVQPVLPANFGKGRRADSVCLIVRPSNTVEVKTAPAGDVAAHRSVYQ